MSRLAAPSRAPALGVAGLLALAAPSALCAGVGEVVASVGAEIITVADLRAELSDQIRANDGAFDADDPEERGAALDRLIERRFLYLGALESVPGAGAVADSVRHHERIRATWTAFTTRAHPGDDALTYERMEDLRERRAHRWYGRHVVVDVREQAEAVLARVHAGEAFDALAREFSTDGGSAGAGGRLYPFRHGDWWPEMTELAFSLRPGEVGGPVRTRLGYHVMLCDSVLDEMEDDVTADTYGLRMRRLRMAELGSLETLIQEEVSALGIRVDERAVELVLDHLQPVGDARRPGRKAPLWEPPEIPMAVSAAGDTMSIDSFFAEMEVLGGYHWAHPGNRTSIVTAAQRLMIAYVMRRGLVEGTYDIEPEAHAAIDAVVQRHLGNLFLDEVVDPGPVDSLEAERIFDTHPEGFMVPASASVASIGVSSAEFADSLEAWVAGGMSFEAAAERMRDTDAGSFYTRRTPFFGKGSFPEHDELLFSVLDVGEMGPREKTSSGYQFYQLYDRRPERPARRLELTTETLIQRAHAYMRHLRRQEHLQRLEARHPLVRHEDIIGAG